jgi:nitrate/TMAO reductase-like tetraheme cytochrome c subunit
MLNPQTPEEIHQRIIEIKDEIFEIREQINSETCRRCHGLYDKMMVLEQELNGWNRELKNKNH